MATENGTDIHKAFTLRERRRLATAVEITEAALHLFETVGVEKTTVADIAEAAGISPRTFFRYFETKELSAFIVNSEYVNIVEEWSQERVELDDVFGTMLDMLKRAVGALDHPESREHLLRARRLIRTEPSIRIAAMSREASHIDRLESALRSRSNGAYTDLEITTLSRVASSMLNAAILEWEQLFESGDEQHLSVIFDEVRDAVGSAIGGRKATSEKRKPTKQRRTTR
ncbi:TetR family transcriptional regulator [Burkholderia sp. Ax-1719]|uniref:TetR family transcriptional regulator n=1 Tax=Burkholderia sp. Ax-1719 TaxID=2608334 RepID=UPI00141E74DA|nr:TetR family transcriptional regulator [Burkholderia sp. Ax-1719]NIE66885.1 TetR family transcriptional regulator [Burkholderia sp. Ax-1719]